MAPGTLSPTKIMRFVRAAEMLRDAGLEVVYGGQYEMDNEAVIAFVRDPERFAEEREAEWGGFGSVEDFRLWERIDGCCQATTRKGQPCRGRIVKDGQGWQFLRSDPRCFFCHSHLDQPLPGA